MAKVSAIVLAAGLSSRMGAINKMGLIYQGKPIVHHVIDQLSKSEAFEIIIVTSVVSKELFPGRKITLNERFETGMTSSIQAGVAASLEEADGYMICLGDQPLIQTEDYDQIIEAFDKHLKDDLKVITLPTFDGKKGNPVLFSSHYKNDILNHQQPEGCKEIVQINKSHVVFRALKTSAILQDVDRPEDYEWLVKGNL